MLDSILRGGKVVDADGVRFLDLGIKDGKIAARLLPNQEASALRSINLDGRLLLPGLVDAHVHLREPGMTWKEDFATGTRAAIAGGVTTVLVMPTDDPWTTTPHEFREKSRLAENRIHCDVGLQVATSAAGASSTAAELARLGAVSFEIFTSDVRGDFLHGTAADLANSIGAVCSAGGKACVSPGDQSLLEAALATVMPGKSTPEDFVRSRPAAAEAQGIAAAVLAARAAGAPVHLRQCSSKEGFDTFRRLRSMADVTIETGVHCLLYTKDDYERLGVVAKASPPWRTEEDRDALRAAVRDNVIDILVTDHAPHSLEEKLAHRDDFANVPGGFPGVQTFLPALLSLVDAGVIAITDLVRLASTRPAEIFRLSDRKGSLKVGADADVIVVNPDLPMTIRNADQLSKSNYTPFDGLAVSASLEQVFLRGVSVLSGGVMAGDAYGKLIRPGL